MPGQHSDGTPGSFRGIARRQIFEADVSVVSRFGERAQHVRIMDFSRIEFVPSRMARGGLNPTYTLSCRMASPA